MGRQRKQGERWPSGKLKAGNKPAIEPFAPALIQRIKRAAKSRCEDAKLGSEVGHLLMKGEFTAAQAAAAFKVANIYGHYEFYIGRSRSSRSASYDSAHGELLLDDKTLAKREKREAAAHKTWLTLQAAIPFKIRNAIELLIVEDRAINSMLLHDMRRFLDQLALKWRDEAAQQAKGGAGEHIPLHFNRHEARRQGPRLSEFDQAKHDRASFREDKATA